MINFGYVGIDFFLFIGVFQLGWAADYFSKYNKYKKMEIYKPSKDILKSIKFLMKSTIKANPKYQSDVINLKVFDSQNKGIWNARFLGNIVFFISKKRRTVFFADKNSVNIEKNGQKILSKKLKVTFQINGENYQALMKPDLFSRFESWKYASMTPTYSMNPYETSSYCPICGVKLNSFGSFCSQCGTELYPKASF